LCFPALLFRTEGFGEFNGSLNYGFAVLLRACRGRCWTEKEQCALPVGLNDYTVHGWGMLLNQLVI